MHVHIKNTLNIYVTTKEAMNLKEGLVRGIGGRKNVINFKNIDNKIKENMAFRS